MLATCLFVGALDVEMLHSLGMQVATAAERAELALLGCAPQFRVSVFRGRMPEFPRTLRMCMEFRMRCRSSNGGRGLKVVSRARQEDSDGGELEDSSWDSLPLATEETLQRMVTLPFSCVSMQELRDG